MFELHIFTWRYASTSYLQFSCLLYIYI
uniref:Uncharacterized protein n=1 Tax=Rhizophora mucronata TaxID=61149 RepID=A0A2P2QGF5_RHIMU